MKKYQFLGLALVLCVAAFAPGCGQKQPTPPASTAPQAPAPPAKTVRTM